MKTIKSDTVPFEFVLHKNVRDGKYNVDISIDNTSIIGFYVDGDDVVLKTWGDNRLYKKYNISHHYLNHFDRLIITGIDELEL